ncbi:ATP-grasp fold amidoligase family protein [Winogradskyella pacifica]|uniref:ATP-grasp fold amidoligase family protein n=1 Tax=Winogradskyella pacifica TaxID=664642 RepID=UPI0015C98802|nr:ATP-grasp fold amidoligase family protein [Winogradskyella pacifica]
MGHLRKQISRFYRDDTLGYLILRPLYKLYQLGLKFTPDKLIIKKSFKKHMGYKLDLTNPQTLNEKINWLKLYNKKKLHTIIADKYKVRNYIKEVIGEQFLIPLYLQTKIVNDIRPENLPDSNFIIKTNHGSSGGIIVREKSRINWQQTRIELKHLLKENHFYSTREWQYKNIEPRIIVEKLLTNEDGSIPDDYKFHCFNGKVAFIMVDIGRHTNKRTRNLYDRDWNLIPCIWERPNGKDIKTPVNLKEMIKLAEILAKDFINIRVDFYDVKGFIYFGELTLHHASGFQKFSEQKWDYKFGQLLNIKNVNV